MVRIWGRGHHITVFLEVHTLETVLDPCPKLRVIAVELSDPCHRGPGNRHPLKHSGNTTPPCRARHPQGHSHRRDAAYMRFGNPEFPRWLLFLPLGGVVIQERPREAPPCPHHRRRHTFLLRSMDRIGKSVGLLLRLGPEQEDLCVTARIRTAMR